MDAMTLVQIKQKYDISRRAIQGYEKNGLVKSTGKTKRGYLTYDEKSVQRIRDIKLYQEMGFQVKEIASVIDAPYEIKKIVLAEKRIELMKKKEKIILLIDLLDQRMSKL